jgi:hypothetical protein
MDDVVSMIEMTGAIKASYVSEDSIF